MDPLENALSAKKRDPYLVHQAKSFGYAINGMAYSFKKGTHLKIHVAAFVIVVILGLIFNVATYEWLILILVSSAVIGGEVMNTAIEETCDVLHPEHHPRAKLAKHCAAGAVLVLSIAAFVIGAIIFIPKILG